LGGMIHSEIKELPVVGEVICKISGGNFKSAQTTLISLSSVFKRIEIVKVLPTKKLPEEGER